MLFELWCWRRLLRVPWTARRSNQSILKETSWVFIGRTDAEAETPIFWPPNAKSWLFGKDPDAGRDWGQEEKETTEDEMAGWHHRLDAHEFGWTPGVGDGQGGLACCDSWSRKASDTTERLNWTELNWRRATQVSLNEELQYPEFPQKCVCHVYSTTLAARSPGACSACFWPCTLGSLGLFSGFWKGHHQKKGLG